MGRQRGRIDPVTSIQRSRFGAHLEDLLVRHGLVQADLAKRVGVSQQTVSKWITGETLPRPKLVPLLEEAIGVESGELGRFLFGGPNGSSRSLVVPKSDLSALSRKLSRLDPNELARVEAYIDGLFDARH
ncbi:MAG: helix-turn-helix protein [Acidimicrobiales bacterium]|nr:helix-turn-helix protein [Acidimicrobiales bacterium]